MWKKALIYLSLLLILSGSVMFYLVDVHRAQAREQRRKLRETAIALAKQRAEAAAQLRHIEEQKQAEADQNEQLLRSAPIQVEHVKTSSTLQHIAHRVEQDAKRLTTQKITAERLSVWKKQLAATGFQFTERRSPSNLQTSMKYELPERVIPSHEDLTTVAARHVVPTCELLKKPTFAVALKINRSGKIVAMAPLSPTEKIPSSQIQRCRFLQPKIKQKVAVYRTVIVPPNYTGRQARL